LSLSSALGTWRAYRNRQQERIGAWLDDPERESTVFLVLTLAIGAIVGGAIVAFIVVTERLGDRLFPLHDSAWRRFLVPAGVALVAGLLLHRYFPDARGSGIPQTKAALLLGRGRISLRTVLGKFFCTAATIAGGIPLGREGPSVQVGAGIASVMGRTLRLSTSRIKQLVPVGATAAVAAAFNTPIAAVLFTLEELLGNMHAPVLGNVVLGAATSWLVLRLALGNEPLFPVPAYELVHPSELVIYALLGVIGGLISVGFIRLLLRMRGGILNAPAGLKPFFPALGGVLVGGLAIYVPEVLGTGYRFVGDALNGHMLLQVMAPLLVLKIVTVACAYATGNAGGIFGPSLFMGAMVGGALGHAANTILPSYTAAPGAYALVGMGALFAGIVRAPFTSVIMIFELTHDYAIIVPLMISNAASLVVSKRLQKDTVYEALAKQDGVVLPSHERRHHERTVRDVMRSPSKAESDALAVLMDRAARVRLDPDDTLEGALEKLGLAGISMAEVVDDETEDALKIATLDDILGAYGIGAEGSRVMEPQALSDNSARIDTGVESRGKAAATLGARPQEPLRIAAGLAPHVQAQLTPGPIVVEPGEADVEVTNDSSSEPHGS